MKKMKFMVILAALLTTFLTAQAQVKITGGPVLQNVTQNSFTVIWTTDMPAVSWVEIAPNDGTHFYKVTRPAF